MASYELTNHPDIQGLLFRGYPGLGQAAYGMFQIKDREAFQRWMQQAIEDYAFATASDGQVRRDETSRMNIGLTASGVQKLVGDGFIADTFEPAFIDGMVQEHRSRRLGDVEVNDPKHWRWGNKGDIDGVLMVFADSREAADALLAGHMSSANGASLGKVIHGHTRGDGKEEFGFADGISQPVIKDTPRYRKLAAERPREAELNGVPAGEMVLGYKDGTGHLPRTPAVSYATDPHGFLDQHPEWPERLDLGKNGTFMAFRQLAQDANGFWEYLEANADTAAGETPQELAEKMVGRRMNGTSMEPDARQYPNNNEFDFANDLKGLHCPVGSHVRRSNPRSTGSDTPKGSLEVSLRHRIIRRGRPYRNDETGEVGLQFKCFNASLHRQFEFIQSAWCNNPQFHGLQSEIDPIIGTVRPSACPFGSLDKFTIPATPYRRELDNLKTFVTVKGGAYFFLPSIPALKCMAHAKNTP